MLESGMDYYMLPCSESQKKNKNKNKNKKKICTEVLISFIHIPLP